MKKTVIASCALVLFAFSIIIGCAKTENISTVEVPSAEAVRLSTSASISRNSSYLSNFGEMKFGEAILKRMAIEGADSATLIVVPVTKQGKVIASLEAVRIPQGKLPYGDDYALNLVDLRSFDLVTLTGKVEMVDVNYDHYIHSVVSVKGNKVKSWIAKGLSDELEAKFDRPEFKQVSRRSSNTAQMRSAGGGIYGLCDGNGDHNISFSECYKCAKDAISADGFSDWVCDFPVLGWLSCWGTTTAACVVVSSKY